MPAPQSLHPVRVLTHVLMRTSAHLLRAAHDWVMDDWQEEDWLDAMAEVRELGAAAEALATNVSPHFSPALRAEGLVLETRVRAWTKRVEWNPEPEDAEELGDQGLALAHAVDSIAFTPSVPEPEALCVETLYWLLPGEKLVEPADPTGLVLRLAGVAEEYPAAFFLRTSWPALRECGERMAKDIPLDSEKAAEARCLVMILLRHVRERAQVDQAKAGAALVATTEAAPSCIWRRVSARDWTVQLASETWEIRQGSRSSALEWIGQILAAGQGGSVHACALTGNATERSPSPVQKREADRVGNQIETFYGQGPDDLVSYLRRNIQRRGGNRFYYQGVESWTVTDGAQR